MKRLSFYLKWIFSGDCGFWQNFLYKRSRFDFIVVVVVLKKFFIIRLHYHHHTKFYVEIINVGNSLAQLVSFRFVSFSLYVYVKDNFIFSLYIFVLFCLAVCFSSVLFVVVVVVGDMNNIKYFLQKLRTRQ